MTILSSSARKRLPESSFAIPETRSYPIHDESHARNALARVAQRGTAEEKKRVQAAVHRRYPGIGREENARSLGIGPKAAKRMGGM